VYDQILVALNGDLAGLILGSTAHKVIHLADRQVLVVR
jgi:nucleotide-binding universal stress UspA family protein